MPNGARIQPTGIYCKFRHLSYGLAPRAFAQPSRILLLGAVQRIIALDAGRIVADGPKERLLRSGQGG